MKESYLTWIGRVGKRRDSHAFGTGSETFHFIFIYKQ